MLWWGLLRALWGQTRGSGVGTAGRGGGSELPSLHQVGGMAALARALLRHAFT